MSQRDDETVSGMMCTRQDGHGAGYRVTLESAPDYSGQKALLAT